VGHSIKSVPDVEIVRDREFPFRFRLSVICGQNGREHLRSSSSLDKSSAIPVTALQKGDDSENTITSR